MKHPLIHWKTYIFVLFLFSDSIAQQQETPIRIFGYFQNSLQQQWESIDNSTENTFSLQQLNLFFQKDLRKDWRAFVNFEFLNNFSSSRQWGAADLDEAWIRYRHSEKFNLKIGLLIPIFNNLNEIKNRTPLLPYIIRPLVYETSFNEFIAIDDYTPNGAFVQAYGFLPAGRLKFDYAVYVGNSPNISIQTGALDETEEQSGIDTTNTFLVGGRLGLRYEELKLGLSLTRDNDNRLQGAASILNRTEEPFEEVPRTRVGGDLSYHVAGFSFEGEFILFRLQDESEIDLERNFFYGTLGYRFTDNLYAYGSYWWVKDALQFFDQDVESIKIKVPTVGLAYHFSDRITFKAQYAFADIEAKASDRLEFAPITAKNRINIIGVAASVFF